MKKTLHLPILVAVIFMLLAAVILTIFQIQPDFSAPAVRAELEKVLDCEVDFSSVDFTIWSGLEISNLELNCSAPEKGFLVTIAKVKAPLTWAGLIGFDPYLKQVHLQNPEIYISPGFFENDSLKNYREVMNDLSESAGAWLQPASQKFLFERAIAYSSAENSEIYRLFSCQSGGLRLDAGQKAVLDLGNLQLEGSNFSGNIEMPFKDRELVFRNFTANYLEYDTVKKYLPGEVVETFKFSPRYITARLRELTYSAGQADFDAELFLMGIDDADSVSHPQNIRMSGQGQLNTEPFRVKINTDFFSIGESFLPGELKLEMDFPDTAPRLRGSYLASGVDFDELSGLLRNFMPPNWPDFFLSGSLAHAGVDFSHDSQGLRLSGAASADSFAMEILDFPLRIENRGFDITFSDSGGLLPSTDFYINQEPCTLALEFKEQFQNIDLELQASAIESEFLARLIPYPYFLPAEWNPAGQLDVEFNITGPLFEPAIEASVFSDQFSLVGLEFNRSTATVRAEKEKLTLDPFRGRFAGGSVGGTLVTHQSPARFDVWARFVNVDASELPAQLNILAPLRGRLSFTYILSSGLQRPATRSGRINLTAGSVDFATSWLAEYRDMVNRVFVQELGLAEESDFELIPAQYGEKFDKLEGILRFRGQNLEIETVLLENDNFQLLLEGTDAPGALDIRMNIFPNFDRLLTELSRPARRLIIEGLPGLKITGTRENPDFNREEFRTEIQQLLQNNWSSAAEFQATWTSLF